MRAVNTNFTDTDQSNYKIYGSDMSAMQLLFYAEQA